MPLGIVQAHMLVLVVLDNNLQFQVQRLTMLVAAAVAITEPTKTMLEETVGVVMVAATEPATLLYPQAQQILVEVAVVPLLGTVARLHKAALVSL